MRHVTSMLIFVPRGRGNNEDNKQQTYVNTSTASFPPTRQMAEYDRSGTCRSASWRTTATRLLRNSTRSQSATPTEIELTGLCITFQQCQSDQLLGLHNIGVIRDFFLDPKRQIQKRLMLMSVACSSFGRYSSVEHHSRYSSSLLVNFICDLSEHATRYIHDERYARSQAPADCLSTNPVFSIEEAKFI
jgi:hypothetical protein